jgi:hypothetical protein
MVIQDDYVKVIKFTFLFIDIKINGYLRNIDTIQIRSDKYI